MLLIIRMRQRACCNCVCLWRQSISYLCMFPTNCQLDYPRFENKYRWLSVDTYFEDVAGSMSLLFLALNTTNTLFLDICKQLPGRLPRSNTEDCWHSVDTHFQDGAGSVLLLHFSQKPANTSFINGCNQSPHRLHIMHSQTLLTPCQRLFSEWCSDCVIYILCLAWLPVHVLWIAATRSHLNYCTFKTNNHWRSIDAPLMLHWRSIDAPLKLHWRSIDAHCQGGASVSNSSGPSLRFWVWVHTKRL